MLSCILLINWLHYITVLVLTRRFERRLPRVCLAGVSLHVDK